MSTERIKHGQTFSLTGTLGANGTLVGLTGNPGALIEVVGFAVNKGDIQLNGARALHKHGATLSDTGTLTNAGTLTVGGGYNSAHGALLGIEGTLTNTGALVAEAGVYGVGGQIDIGGSGLMRNSGMLSLVGGVKGGSDGATLSDSGRLVNEARGVIDVHGVTGPLSLGSNVGSGGLMTVSGTLDNHGIVNIYDCIGSFGSVSGGTVAVSGVLQNSGTVLVGATGAFSAGYAGALLSVSGTLQNSGTVFVTGGPTSSGPIAVAGTLAISGTFIDQGQLTLQKGGGSYHFAFAGQDALLVDTGRVENSGTLTNGGIADILGTLSNTGVLLEQQNSSIDVSGTMTNYAMLTALGGASSSYIQVYRGLGGYTSVSGTLVNASAGTITLNGGLSDKYRTFPYPSEGFGAAVVVSGRLVNHGLIVAGGGAGGYPINYYSDFGAGATISVASGGTLMNGGKLEIQQAATSSYGLSGTGGMVTIGGYLDNYGVIGIAGGVGAATGEVDVASTGRLSPGTIEGSGVLLNQGTIGTFILGNGAISSGEISGVSFINDGTVDGGILGMTIDSAITSDPGKTGLMEIFSQGQLALNGAVAASQTVAFAAASFESFLELGNAASFSGTLSGISSTDVIDFLKQDITSASTTGDKLAIGVAGGETIDLALAAPLSGLSLTLQSDGQGGTDLVFGLVPGH